MDPPKKNKSRTFNSMAEITTNKLIYDMTSEEYHGSPGYSSSQLKDLLDDPEYFYKKYIAKTEEKISIPAFDIGTYFHTAILEPDKLTVDCAVYKGIRRGKEWEAFKAANVGKTIVTETEMTQAESLAEAVRNSPVAMSRIELTRPEVSAYVELTVGGGEVYESSTGSILGKYGWEKAKRIPEKNVEKILVKVRADALSDAFILDLKSTSGNAKSLFTMRKKISEYNYDLSAALYLDIFTIVTGVVKSEFVWTFASKDYFNSKSYIASDLYIQVGRAKWRKAIIELSHCLRSNWVFEDSMGILEPNLWETEILKPKDEDLL